MAPSSTTRRPVGIGGVTVVVEEKETTCCDCCHIKHGTVFLGLIEMMIAAFVLLGISQQLAWKNRHSSLCFKDFWRDCLIFKFSHFNVTLFGDYVTALLMVLILLSVLLMFVAICTDSPLLMVPHIVVQAVFLIFSVGYFFLYAWSYFYGDLHTQSQEFQLQPFIERMWLASLLLLLAVFQTYLFQTVIQCFIHLQKRRVERRRRASQFEECSNRVRRAKENGMWRNTSWGGGFLEYKGQDSAQNLAPKKKKTHMNHVQWDLQKNSEKSISIADEVDENKVNKEKSEPNKNKPPEVRVEEATEEAKEQKRTSPKKETTKREKNTRSDSKESTGSQHSDSHSPHLKVKTAISQPIQRRRTSSDSLHGVERIERPKVSRRESNREAGELHRKEKRTDSPHKKDRSGSSVLSSQQSPVKKISITSVSGPFLDEKC